MTTAGATLLKPETLRQAQTFTVVRNRYSGQGLCDRCAAAAGFAHQHGFGQIDKPCAACRPIVDGFTVERVNGWRSLPRRVESNVPSVSALGPAGPTPPVSADADTKGPSCTLSRGAAA